MSKSSLQPYGLPVVAEYLADREALTGEARAAFLRLLHRSFHYRRPSGSRPPVWIGIAGVSGFAGLAIDACHSGAHLSACQWSGWILWSVLGLVFAALSRRAAPADDRDLDLQWLVYCGVVHPIIVREHPELLARDSAPPAPAKDKFDISADRSFRIVLGESRTQLCQAVLGGMWAGELLLLGWRLWDNPPGKWVMLVPLVGMVLAPVVWAGAQWAAYNLLVTTSGSKR